MKSLLVAGAAAGAAAWAVRGRSSSVFAPSVWRGPADRREIALTFDDGPGEATEPLLDALGEYAAPATFFQVGLNVEKWPRIARAVREAGHEIGNHSYSHPYFFLRTPAGIHGELERAQRVIFDATGTTPAYLRVPYGARWFGLRQAQHQLGLTGVMWTVIGLDWKLPAGAVADRIGRGLVNGAIICLHDARAEAVLPAVKRLLPEIRTRGFKLVTISRLLCPTT